jgi:hypothetical protein
VKGKGIVLVIAGGKYPVEVENARMLAERLRRIGGGAGGPSDRVATILEAVIAEEAGPPREIPLHNDEAAAIRAAVWEWLNDVGAQDLPDSVMNLRYAFHREEDERT